jgi:hypothetical protein
MIITKGTILTQSYEILPYAFNILVSADFMEFHTVDSYSSLVLTRVKNVINKLSRLEEE